MIETEGADQLEKLKMCPQLSNKGLIFDKPKRRFPRVMVYDVEVPDTPEELVADIYEQNLPHTDITLKEFKKDFKAVHKYKKRDDRDNRETLVIECMAKIRNVIRQRDRLYIGWQSCGIKDFNPLVRCYKCQSFGHVAKHCRGKTVCPQCAEPHELSECKNKTKYPKCANCFAGKKDSKHCTGHVKCPEFVRATKIAHKNVDYGN